MELDEEIYELETERRIELLQHERPEPSSGMRPASPY
jgi:hypothetical protein